MLEEIEYLRILGCGNEGIVSGLVWMECKVDVRGRGWEMRLGFSLDLVVFYRCGELGKV